MFLHATRRRSAAQCADDSAAGCAASPRGARWRFAALAVAVAGCAPTEVVTPPDEDDAAVEDVSVRDAAFDATLDLSRDAADWRDVTPREVTSPDRACAAPGTPPTIAVGVQVAAPFDAVYRAYDLGAVPGVPRTRYGGCLIDRADPNLLYIGVDSETPAGSIWAVRVVRGCAGHIIGYEGTARRVAGAPYVDANLFYDRDGNLLYSMWPQSSIGIMRPGAAAPSQVIDLVAFGVPRGASPGGLAFVPTGFASAGELRAVGWSDYGWFRLPYGYAGGVYALRPAERRAMFTQGTGGIAYVPSGSPLITRPSIVMAEWSTSVSFFDVDPQGDPLVATRRPFLTGLTNAWGAYFEPVTGDFMFPSWGNDRVVIVQGFQAPPMPPAPP